MTVFSTNFDGYLEFYIENGFLEKSVGNYDSDARLHAKTEYICINIDAHARTHTQTHTYTHRKKTLVKNESSLAHPYIVHN